MTQIAAFRAARVPFVLQQKLSGSTRFAISCAGSYEVPTRKRRYEGRRSADDANQRLSSHMASPRHDENATESLWQPIGTWERPAVSDRYMGLSRFITAQLQREKMGWPLGAGPPLLVTTSVILHTATAYAFLIAPGPGVLELSLCAASYGVRMFGITGVFHRYFAHGSYQTSRAMQFVLACFGTAAWQKGAGSSSSLT